MNNLRSLPSVDQLLLTPQLSESILSYGRPITVDAVRFVLEEVRANYSQDADIPGEENLLGKIEQTLQTWVAPSLRAVINATGVILHTNLGRAPLSQSALMAIQIIGSGYSTLEFDLSKGKRGSRLIHAEALLKRITGAEDALVVNNNAGAVMLALTALARRRAVVIARSQLVEIGGGFRVPDVMKQSGARLVEVGTTNRIHARDYITALEEKPAMIFRAHRSNFQILGFTSEPELAELADIARQAGIPLVDDLGSGALIDTARYRLGHEPMVQESLADGADLVCFSGDKLLGGPQAGIIVGNGRLIGKLKKHPLARAIRADKLCLAALTETLLHYLKDEVEQEIPIWRMIAASEGQIRKRAQMWADSLEEGDLILGESTVGGGSLPGETLPTTLMAFNVRGPNSFLSRLRSVQPVIIARLKDNRVVMDPRTVLPEQDQDLLNAVKQLMNRKK